MSFRISQKTLERLEWPEILRRLAEHTRSPQARARVAAAGPDGIPGTGLFEADAAGVRERLAETSQALAVLELGDGPPLGGVAELSSALARARKGGVLDADSLQEVGATLAALEETGRFLGSQGSLAPALADLADTIAAQPVLRAEIAGCLHENGEVRDEASAELARARRESHRLAGEIQQRISRMLHDPDVEPRLSDSYFTVRNDRYVLPVRADAKGSVRGIVHDASRSGTTLFIEPEALVELNNRHKRAELVVEQETRRVLRELSEAVADAGPAIESGIEALERIDLAFARAHLARAQQAVLPEVEDEGAVDLPQLRHPLIPRDEAVPNDLRLGLGFRVLVLSGPNAGGKTVAMKSVALAALLARAGLGVPALAPARIDVFDAVLADIGDEQDIREHLSTFSAHMANLAHIVERADARTLVVLDEIGVGTDPGEGAAIAQAVLESLADAGARTITTTHYNLLKEMAEVDERFANASVEFDPDTLVPTYRLRMGLPGSSSASAVAARMGLSRGVLERADALLSREDRQLDRMLTELAASRAALEHEQREAQRLRAETDAVRGEYTARLEKLQARRDTLYRAMRDDLDRAFRDAHAQIAGVVRDLQRGDSTSQQAARARAELLALQERARQAESEAGVEAPAAKLRPLDWNRARPGDPVALHDGGTATLVALPDRRGRVAVRLGSARVVMPMEWVGAPDVAPQSGRARPGGTRTAVRVQGDAVADDADAIPSRCDLRGLRVDEALDRLDDALDRAAAAGHPQLLVIHGVGTGALRRAVQAHLRESPYVSHFLPGDPEEGGDGVTTAHLEA
jgi:DNA mismatch repair protein MutS2